MNTSAKRPTATPEPRLRVMLAGSGGGHVRQLLDLEPVWSRSTYCFLTEDTALGRSIATDHPTHFVPHVALGQAKLGSPWKMVREALRSFFISAGIVARVRPDLVVTTGAGSVYFAVLCARLLGARIILVDSLARFDRLSAFARIAAPLAHRKVVQSAALARNWPDAEVFDPIRVLEGQRPPKKPVLFATVGATLPFDRLVQSVAELKSRGEIPERVFVQTGIGGVQPAGLEVVETLRFEEMGARLREADIVVCHGGTGSLITALREGCHVIAMPRLYGLGEHYDDHQEEITSAFEARGLIQVARTTEELAAGLRAARTRAPVMATSEPRALATFLETQMAGEARRRKRAFAGA